MSVKGAFQTALRLVYPPRCTLCGEQVESDFGLCGRCWRDTPFIAGLTCHLCGVPLPGSENVFDVPCDDCLRISRPWRAGAAALLYHDNGRKLVLALKHGDRQEIVRPAVQWMARLAGPLLEGDPLLAPVPLHWTRLLRRRFNQSALLSRALARRLGQEDCPDLLLRRVRTPPLARLDYEGRFRALSDAIAINPAQAHRARARPVLLIDDVMTSGATLAACAEACLAAGAGDVRILTLARAAKDA